MSQQTNEIRVVVERRNDGSRKFIAVLDSHGNEIEPSEDREERPYNHLIYRLNPNEEEEEGQ